jgi:hypothetical protein
MCCMNVRYLLGCRVMDPGCFAQRPVGRPRAGRLGAAGHYRAGGRAGRPGVGPICVCQ